MNNWTLYRWIWRLESQLSIGFPPAGSLNRCRLYVPSRVIHGTLAAEIARLKDNAFPDYGKLGWELALNCRFTYLYPAEKIGDDYMVWLPQYKGEKGFCWEQQGNDEHISDRKFRSRLLNSIAGTAIAPDTDSASEGSLHETECVNPFWRNSVEPSVSPRPVYLAGYVFLRNNGFRRQLESSNLLFFGGDTRYGLGKVKLEKFDQGDGKVFGNDIDLENENPVIEGDYVLGHALTNDENMSGQKELLGGWEQDKQWEGELSWCPGSFCDTPKRWVIEKDKYGYWKGGD